MFIVAMFVTFVVANMLLKTHTCMLLKTLAISCLISLIPFTCTILCTLNLCVYACNGLVGKTCVLTKLDLSYFITQCHVMLLAR